MTKDFIEEIIKIRCLIDDIQKTISQLNKDINEFKQTYFIPPGYPYTPIFPNVPPYPTYPTYPIIYNGIECFNEFTTFNCEKTS